MMNHGVYKPKKEVSVVHNLDKEALAKMTYVKDDGPTRMGRIESKVDRLTALVKGLVEVATEVRDLMRKKEEDEVAEEHSEEESSESDTRST